MSHSTDLFTLTRKTTTAFAPRSRWSNTISPADNLQLVYHVYAPKYSHPSSRSVPFNIVLGHLAQATKAVWYHLIRALFDHDHAHPESPWHLRRVLVFDTVAQGDSALLNEAKLGITNAWADNAWDLIKLIYTDERLYEYGKTIAVGHSYGGTMALFAAAYRPDLLDSLVVAEPVACNPQRPNPAWGKAWIEKVFALSRSRFASWEEARNFHNTKSFFKVLPQHVRDDIFEDDYYYDPSTKKITKKSHYKYNRPVNTGFLLSNLDLFPVLHRLQIPVTYVHGSYANWLSEGNIRDTLAELPNKQVRVIPKTGHMCCLQRPDLFFEIVLEHLNKRAEKLQQEGDFGFDGKVEFSDKERKMVWKNWDREYTAGAFFDPSYNPKPKL